MVPVQPEPTAVSPHTPLTTAASSQDQKTTVKTTPYVFPDGDNEDEKVEYYFSFYSNLWLGSQNKPALIYCGPFKIFKQIL